MGPGEPPCGVGCTDAYVPVQGQGESQTGSVGQGQGYGGGEVRNSATAAVR